MIFFKSKYRLKLFLYFFFIISIFSIIIVFFQYKREKRFKIEKLETSLNVFVEQINHYVLKRGVGVITNRLAVKEFFDIIQQEELRITIIDLSGKILYDSSVDSIGEMENHFLRPEIQSSIKGKYGSDIRKSATTNKYYYYYAKKYDKYFVRAALPYTERVEQFLKADNYFIIFILFLFVIVSFLLIYISDHFGKTISNLKEFAIKAGSNEELDNIIFEDNELGIIGKEIKSIYNKMSKTTKELSLERDRLVNFLNVSREGIGIFSNKFDLILSNNHFISYINLISSKVLKNPQDFLNESAFHEITKFINNSIEAQVHNIDKKFTLFLGDKYFLFQVVILSDYGFEISINDITETENEKKLKQKMTTNIAHELKTPVAAISGYMETILNNPAIPTDKIYSFVEKSFKQSKRLALLIQDITTLNKIDKAKNMFELEEINIFSVVKSIFFDFDFKLKENNITYHLNIEKDTIIEGNKFLIDTIFRNLIDNSIKYAGKFSTIKIETYFKDDGYYYFSYSDTGEGIPEKSLSKIFERFYRVDSGRSRKLGGTGLGLSIVKHAVNFHNGEIYAKSLPDKGIEFNFSLKK